ncbi:MAG TPA: lipopolysaccharide biosynthesis protein [Armatimonadota bacterium]
MPADIPATTEPESGIPTGFGRKLIGNSMVIGASRAVSILTFVIITPVVIARLGLQAYGVWEILLALTAWLAVFDVGISGAILRFASEAKAKGDIPLAARYVTFGLCLNGVMALVVGSAAYYGSGALVSRFHVPDAFARQAAQLITLLVVVAFCRAAVSSVAALIIADHRTGLVAVLNAIGGALGLVVTVAALSVGHGILSLGLGQVANVAFAALATLASVAVIYRGSMPRPHLPHWDDVVQLYRYGGLLFVAQTAALLGEQTDKLVLGYLSDARWVATYAIAVRLAGIVREFSAFIYGPTVPAAAALSAIGDWDRIRRLFHGSVIAVSSATGAVALLIVGLHPRIEVAWLGRYYPATTPLVIGLVFAFSFHMLTGPGTAICRGVNRVDIEAAYQAVYLALNIALTVTLTALIGPTGTVVATIAALASGTAFFLWRLHRVLQLPRATTAIGLRCLGVAFAVGLTTYASMRAVPMPSARMAAFGQLTVGTVAALAFYGAALVLFRILGSSGESAKCFIGAPCPPSGIGGQQ